MRREELIGRTIANRFRITRVLGEGGMATVFVAEQDAEPREIALKILRDELNSDKTFAKRFEREAKAAARVQHPNSVTIFDSGVEGKLSYIAMELLRGDDLFTLLERHGVLSPRVAATIVAEVCDALAVAHPLGIVHRDLKPENIMIVRDSPALDGNGPASVAFPPGARVKVLDFGIAKLLDKRSESPRGGAGRDDLDPPSAITAVTMAGTLIGTPAYMSPEQCAMQPIDTRSDIYTCGVLLFQMIAGRLPFEGPTPLHIAIKHIHEEPPALRTLLPGADARLEAVILKALAKRANERHPTARNLAAVLRKLLPELSDRPYAPRGSVAQVQAESIDTDEITMDAEPASFEAPEGMVSAKTIVAEGLVSGPASVVVRGNERPHNAGAVVSQRAPAPPADVEPEPEDLVATLIRPAMDSIPDGELARTVDAGAPNQPGNRQPTLQSAPLHAPAPRAGRISVADPPPPLPSAPALGAAPLGRSSSLPLPVSAFVPTAPSASVILAPSLTAAPLPVPPPGLAAPFAPPAPAPTFGLPIPPGAPSVRSPAAPSTHLPAAVPLGRSLWLGIAIGAAFSAIFLVIVYLFFLSH